MSGDTPIHDPQAIRALWEQDATAGPYRAHPTPVDERRGRYYAAMVSGPNALESVLRLVDAELADQAKAVERALDLCQVWETAEPHGLMSRRRAAAILREVLDQ